MRISSRAIILVLAIVAAVLFVLNVYMLFRVWALSAEIGILSEELKSLLVKIYVKGPF